MKQLESIVPQLRAMFPALARRMPNGAPVTFFDGPAGTQVPQMVIDAISDYLVRCNANRHGCFLTADETEECFAKAHRLYADFMGVDDPDEIVFGQNMTSLTFQMSRALSQTWQPGDEIILTRLDHDANVSPWVLAARDRGVTVRWVPFRAQDWQLDLQVLQSHLSGRTRLVACGAASNATGGINPIPEIVSMAHSVGALAYVDAVHLGPHRQINAKVWDADFVVCSAYKFFGPHVGILWGRRELLERVPAYKVRPASNSIPDKWMTGTQNHEGICGAAACVEYLAGIGRTISETTLVDTKKDLATAFRHIEMYESQLTRQFLDGLSALDEFELVGLGRKHLTQPEYQDRRVSTFAIRHRKKTSQQLATALGQRGIFAWHGNYYALELSEQLGYEPEGMLRIGFVHYNTPDEVARLLEELRRMGGA
ncbi:MAG: cysteine desulfurase-like protein [Planctomycetaceae bacterium]|nr:cysteine desulfurase-like protein [Planctomycetaceae bacterium]